MIDSKFSIRIEGRNSRINSLFAPATGLVNVNIGVIPKLPTLGVLPPGPENSGEGGIGPNEAVDEIRRRASFSTRACTGSLIP